MSDSTAGIGASLFNRLINHLRVPLYRNAYALVLSSVATSGLGMLYWLVAARTYSPEVIGLNTAAISALTLLSMLSQLDLVSALSRFIPRAGQATGKLVTYAYLIPTVIAPVLSLIFLLGLEWWTPTLNFLISGFVFAGWFVISTVAWSIFSMQDGVLTGLRQASWVPVKNSTFSIVKIVLLVAFSSLSPQHGVFFSWTIPALILLIPTDWLIFSRLIPQHIRSGIDRAERIVPSQVVRYVVGDYLGAMAAIAMTTLLPVIVTQRLGAVANAYFYLPWTIAFSLFLAAFNMGMSLVAEASSDQEQLETYGRQMFVQMARLMVPAVVVLALGAPYILQLFGNDYALEGATLLRLLSLSVLPNLVTSVAMSVLRVQRRTGMILVIQSVTSAATLGLVLVLLGQLGIVTIGVVFLIVQTFSAVILVLTGLGTTWLRHLFGGRI